MSSKACILGATGLVGSKLISLLVDDPYYTTINVVTRQKMTLHVDTVIQYVSEFENLDSIASAFNVDDVYCCLGTTMKKAGSKEAFSKVDYDYVVKAARLAYLQGAQQFLVISAVGANPHSLFFYNRVKGQMEKDVTSIPFKAVHIFRPSLLVGKRDEKRFFEDIVRYFAQPLQFILKGYLKKYAPVDALWVAQSMIQAAKDHISGVHVYEAL